jgi:raffinose/stachyose/melibiose transport system permease protein
MAVVRVFVRVGIFGLAILWLFVAGVPFYFMAESGFKGQFEFLAISVWAFPKHPTLANFTYLLKGSLLVSFLNSIGVVILSVVIILFVSAMASFVFARMKFRLFSPLFSLVIAGLIVPIHITLIPIYLLTIRIGLYNTLWALIGPYVAFHIPITVFLLTEFMRTIPKELEDAARMDGCGPFRLFFTIILPLSQPGVATLAIYNAVFLWNEFIFAYILISNPERSTLPLAVVQLQGQYFSNIPAILALLTLSSLPLIIVYVIMQERITKGMIMGALKG